jgi:hypothetical protein
MQKPFSGEKNIYIYILLFITSFFWGYLGRLSIEILILVKWSCVPRFYLVKEIAIVTSKLFHVSC